MTQSGHSKFGDYLVKLMAKAGIAFLIFVIAVVAYAFAHFAQQRADSDAFGAIEMGDSALDVVNSLGEPDAIRECSENLWWGGDHNPLGKNDGRCIDEYYYGSMPGGWSVGFSKSGTVVAKYRYVSP